MSGIKQHESQTGTYFCAVTHDLTLADEIKKSILDFKSWAWVYHEPDNDDGTPHVHFLLRANGTRSIKQIADKIELPSNYIQVCLKVVAFRRYMMHLDSPDKKQYDVGDIHTNCHADFRSAKEGNEKKDVNSLFRDFRRLSSGFITPEEFIQLNYVEMSSMAFSQKIRTFETLLNIYKVKEEVPHARLPDSRA